MVKKAIKLETKYHECFGKTVLIMHFFASWYNISVYCRNIIIANNIEVIY